MVLRSDIIKMLKHAVNRCVPPQDSINQLVNMDDFKNLTESDQKIVICKVAAETIMSAYRLSYENVLRTTTNEKVSN